MKNWKTTLFGAIASLPALLHGLGVSNIGHVGSGDWLTLFGGIGTVLFGWYSKDKNVTGGTTPNDQTK